MAQSQGPITASNQCPACAGRRVLFNSKTGNPVTCPLCDGEGKRENYQRLPRWYIINAVITLALGNTPGALAIDAMADFELIWLTRTSSNGVFTTAFQDASGRAWQNLPVNDLNMFGTAERPFPIGLSPVVLRAQTSLMWTVTDLSGIAANTIQMALIGYDLYLAPESASAGQ